MTPRARLPFLTLFVQMAVMIVPLRAELPFVEQAVEQAHSQLWEKFLDDHGIIRDYIGDLPTPEDCATGRPNAIGWWSPIENGPMFTGLYLPAMCERAIRRGDAASREETQRLARGLLKCASVSDVPGFIARGIGTDGKCHYPLSSDDQAHPWFYGLHTYVKSGLPTDDERRAIVSKMEEVAEALQATGWQVPCEGAFRGQYRGGFRGHLFRDAARYLYLLRAMHDVTQNPIWLERYQSALTEVPKHSVLSRLEICSHGYPLDREAIRFIDQSQLWIYVGSQGSLARLIDMETDESIRHHYRAGLQTNVINARSAVAEAKNFNNDDQKIFGSADWRAVYSTWFEQKTQADAERLAKTGDRAKRGERKDYEVRWMRNPLAGAAILSLGGEKEDQDAIHNAIRHYDYSKLNMAEFFFAECAYYAVAPRE